jgi:hypothetical protein
MKKYHLPGFVAVIAIIAQSLDQYVGVSMRRSRSGQIWTKAIRDRGTRKCPRKFTHATVAVVLPKQDTWVRLLPLFG